jgi:transcriptional regulator with XRE-family HTH domain
MDTRKLNISETLESIRLEKRLNKKDFSSLCGISNSFYSEIINNKKSLNLDTLEKICSRIEVPIDVFIFKAINENAIEDDNRRKLIREIRPLMDKIADFLYSESESPMLKARRDFLENLEMK